MNTRRLFGQTLKFYFITIHNMDRIMDLVFWPCVNLLLWGFTSTYLQGLTGSPTFVSLFLGGLLLWTVFERVYQDISFYILEDFWSYSLKNTFASPLTLGELVASIIGFGVIRAVISFIVLSIGASVLYQFHVLSAGAFGIALLSLSLMIFGWSLGIMMISILFRYGVSVQFVCWSLPFMLQPFVGVFYPLSALPSWVLPISHLIPLSYIFEGMRIALHTGVIPWHETLISLALNIPYLILAFMALKGSIAAARKSGLITGY